MATATKNPTSSDPLKPEWLFRSTLNASETIGIIADSSTLAAFSPDIIPLDQIRASPDEIAASYNHFVAHTIDRDEATTFVYIRSKVTLSTGHSSSDAESESSQVDLLAVPNELILWPAIWEQATTLQGHTNLDTKNIISPRNVVVGHPISYKPIVLPNNGQHSHETLVAVRTSSNDRDQSVVAKVNNWRDLVNYVGKNNDISFYNAMAADPRPDRVTLITKLRILENERPFVDLYLGIEVVGTPSNGIIAVLRVLDGGISTIFTIGPQPLLPSKDFGGDLRLPADFSGSVTLEVLNNDKEIFCDYSSISIVLYAVDNSSAGASNHVLIGADHVFFDSNPRVKRLVRKYRPSFLRAEEAENDDVDDTPNFYFRDAIGDSAVFPRNENANSSPDIQPVGSLPLTDPLSTFSNQNADYSTQQNYGITSDQSNYVYVCGYTTIAHKGDIRLFIIPNTALLHPSQYNTSDYIVQDIDTSTGAPTTAIRKYKTTSDDTQQVVATEPFLIVDLSDPPPGNDHYCLVTECKPHRTQEEIDEGNPPYEWPHDEVGEFDTSSEFSAWVLNEPRVAWRNMDFIDNNGGSDYSVRQSFKLFPGVTPTDKLNYKVNAIDCPIGSQYSMDSTDPAVQCGKTYVKTSNQGTSAGFTGKDSTFSCQVVLRWYSNGQSINFGQRLYGQMSHQAYKSSALAKSKQQLSKSKSSQKKVEEGAQSKTQKQKLHVGDAYPSVIAPKSSCVSGRLRIGGAIRARRLTRSKKPVIAKDNFDAYDSDGSGSNSEPTTTVSGIGAQGAWEEFDWGTDTAQTF